MKKTYEKPMLFAESFELAEHVAGTCYLDSMNTPTHRSVLSCGFRVNGDSAIAFQDPDICHGWFDPLFPDQPLDDVFCHNTFLDTAAMFAS